MRRAPGSCSCGWGDTLNVSIVSVERSVACAVLLCCALEFAAEVPGFANRSIANEIADAAPSAEFETFLDRLMGAESGGRSNVTNPRSTAVGAFQFIRSTFLEVVRNHFATEVAGLKDNQILALRKDTDFARRAAAAYSHDNIDQLKQNGLDPTFAQLRLAFLLGPRDAVRLSQAQPQRPVCEILPLAVIKANSFMANMTAADLLVRAASDVEGQYGRRVARSLTHADTCVGAGPPIRQVDLQIACKGRPAVCRQLYILRSRKAAASRARHGRA